MFRHCYEKTKRANCDLQNRMSDMEREYQEKLRDSNDECRRLKAECKNLNNKCADLNQRMAAQIHKDLGSSGVGFENVSDPCNESRLRDIYETLRLYEWPSLKRKLGQLEDEKKKKLYADLVKMWKDMFVMANGRVQNSKEDLKNLFLSDQQQDTKEKVLENLNEATHSLQVAFFLRSDTSYQDIVSPLIKVDVPEKKMLTGLAVRYYKLMCLMLLHNPPMQPDWQKAEGPLLRTEEMMFPPIKMKEEDPMKRLGISQPSRGCSTSLM
ncbi:uncharacterized protein LOC134461646 [Engraulis encrasicolus]|uniref:uncharacterized protein LOC134461646 n=1 Tax=Engraulis encrasicolus TaxID=184585 RepID=UPI002FD733FE